MRRLALLALAASAAGCASAGGAHMAQDALAAPGAVYNAARRSLAPPQMDPVSNPATLTGGQQQTMPQPISAESETPRANSLWRSGSRSFFNDQRASRVGDILTVNIEIDDKAEVSNQSSRSRHNATQAGVPHFFGLENTLGRVLPGGFDPSTMVDATTQSDQQGQGAINRAEKIRLTVAAVIVDRLPNGNLVIAGRQDVMVNAEMRQLTISGVIRPEDISAENTINHTQIAEARISYGGQGQISAAQRPSWGQRITDAIFPW